MKGENVATVAVTLVAMIDSKTGKSSASSVMVPCEMPALAMTMSQPPAWARKASAALRSAAWSVTSAA
jgi:hypothetical protein